ncbi:MAG: DUF916 domain-containing protein [Candidatus Eremiobacteraeota bacterium]|nr:DUF916 domain-containing protein [Candidatus Eremiobacteraeota bacterium]
MKQNIIAALALGALLLAAALPAPADLSLDVAPAKLELPVTANSTQTIPITVRNSGTTPLHIQASLSDFSVGANGDYVFSKPGHDRYTLTSWATVNPREFDVPPNSFQLVRLTLNIPSHITGEYNGIVFFQTRPQRHSGGGISFSERIASKIYAFTSSSLRIDGAVDDIAAKQTSVGERFLVGFKNTGNAHLYLNGRIEIRKGKEFVARVALPAQLLTERGGRRVIEAYSQRLSPGSYTALALIDFGGPSLAGGQTTFTVK